MATEFQRGGDRFLVPVSQTDVIPELNIRKDMGDLLELSKSIEENGIKVPLIGNKKGDRVVIIHGHRRREAALLVKARTGEDIKLPIIMEPKGVTEDQRIVDMVITNTGMELTPLEKADAISRLLNLGWNNAKVAKSWGVSEAYISRLGLLNKAPEELRQAIRDRLISGTFAIDAVKNKRVEEVLAKLKEGGDGDQEITSAEGDIIQAVGKIKTGGKPKSEASESKQGKVTTKDIAEVNSWREFKKAAINIDHKKIADEAAKKEFLFLCKLMNNELTKEQIEKHFKLKKED